MFEAITDVIENMQQINAAWALDILINRPKYQGLIIKLNTEGLPTSQLFELHIDAEGTKLYQLGGEYSLRTLETKQSQNPQDVNLKDTGDAFDSWTVRSKDGVITIDADLVKDGVSLEIRYGPNIIGIFDDNLQILIDAIADDLPEIIEEKLLS